MPTTRRSAAASARGRPGPVKGQSTISFTGKVTKAVPKDLKKAASDSAIARTTIPERPASKDDVNKREQEREAVETVAEETDVIEEPEEEVEPVVEQVSEKSEAELKAEKITDAQIKSYWRAIEKQRKAPRVHQEGLDMAEKVMRYFDVSSQYGPCIGITRMKRWHRAERLGLKPPVEVLAVLMKEENKGTEDFETAHIDRIMNATAALP
ncbi:DNA polymeraseDelta, subunit 4 [Trichoderma parareesei]|uniref:DNA polymeraseDelta, subunit 4 n=1 Tax=Trichoderma parareesei TaxID=858221 RepID=A0A2H2ZQ81_TRIPA|nr:DNA polymeraseDelta, subunit 4 [Trichoderma parareesei]